MLAKVVDEEILIPKPVNVFKSFVTLSKTTLFWHSIMLSIARILIGFFLALVVGTLFAILTVKSRLVMDLFYPLISSVKATPVASFIILALFWLTTGRVPIFICFLM
ncbi:MAG: nitrate ABC transporter permease, partial [Clostridiaceae bacterium]|nr:nitrate ABC transporter permease [Clostridiaceae bacterium]